MLAIARGTMSGPRLLMLDEPSLGIAPLLIPHIYAGIRSVAARGTTVLLVEQNVREALRAADTAYVLQTGRVVLHGAAADLIGDPLVQEAFLGLGAA
jgi:branched-chain amino acid transport system ATP-binding protein